MIVWSVPAAVPRSSLARAGKLARLCARRFRFFPKTQFFACCALSFARNDTVVWQRDAQGWTGQYAKKMNAPSSRTPEILRASQQTAFHDELVRLYRAWKAFLPYRGGGKNIVQFLYYTVQL